MNKITEKEFYCVESANDISKTEIPVSLRFEFVVGNLTEVSAGHTTGWRRMPFHLYCCRPGNDHDTTLLSRLSLEDGTSIIYTPSDTGLFIPAGTLHRLDDIGNSSRNSLWIHFRTIAQNHFDIFTQCKVPHLLVKDKYEELQTLLHRIVAMPQVLDFHHAVWMQICGLSLSTRLLEIAGVNPDNAALEVPEKYRKLKNALKMMEFSTSKPSLDALASSVHLSKSRFLALFAAEMGISPGQYYRQLQLEKACRLLNNPDLSIAACAAASGFSDAFYFSREFKKVFGKNPSEYRRQFLLLDP